MITLLTLSSYLTIFSCSEIFLMNQMPAEGKRPTYCEIFIVKDGVKARGDIIVDSCQQIAQKCGFKEKK